MNPVIVQFTNLHIICIYFAVCDAQVGRQFFQSQKTISYKSTFDYDLCTMKQAFVPIPQNYIFILYLPGSYNCGGWWIQSKINI